MLPSPDLLQADSRCLFFPAKPPWHRSSSNSSGKRQPRRRSGEELGIGVRIDATSAVSSFPLVDLDLFGLVLLAGRRRRPRRGPLPRVPVPAGVLGLGAAQLADHLWAVGAQGAAEAGGGGLCGEAQL